MVAYLGSYRGDPAEETFRPLRPFAESIADLSGGTSFVDLRTMLDAD